MKKLHVIYNHNIFDEPYKQTCVKKTEKEIKGKYGDDVQIYLSRTSMSSLNPFSAESDLIIVEHTFDMTAEDKKYLAKILNTGVTKLKSVDPVDVLVSFRKIQEDDLWFFENGKEE